MYRHPFWILFLGTAILGTCIYTGFTLYRVWQYCQLDKQTPIQDIQWSVLSLNDDTFLPFARYQFMLNGTAYRGEARWHKHYLNEWAATEAISRLKQSPPHIWYREANPSISTLDKRFPLKESLYTGTLWVLVFYLFGLGYHINKKLQGMNNR